MPRMQTFIAYLQLVRAANGLTALSNILAAAVIALTLGSASSTAWSWTDLILLGLSSLSLYYAGMTLNDVVDYAEDLAERPSRPLPSGRVPLRHARLLCGALFASGLVAASAVSLQSLLLAAVLSLCIVAYDCLLKNGMGGAVMMGSCRGLNWLLGLSIVPLSPSLGLWAVPIWLYISALTYLSKQETRAQQPRALLPTALLLIASLCTLLLLAYWYAVWTPLFVGVVAVCTALLTRRLVQTWRSFTPSNIQHSIVFMLIGVIPLDALMVLAVDQPLLAAAIVALSVPTRYLSKRIAMT